jgi:glycosyltransferase involved in cell wall biosynthesis
LLSRADAFVIPTIEDACSLVALEAAAVGLPIITTTRNGATEILPVALSTLVEPGSSSDLRNALISVERLSEDDRLQNQRLTYTSGLLRSWMQYGEQVIGDLCGIPPTASRQSTVEQ